jgi:DNA-directed RNA polymerase I, II, and III subunit RPABC2
LDDGLANGMNGDANIVPIGDGDGQLGQGRTPGAVVDKKIPREKRTTTPYMTQYERARVLGTRALQIRCVFRIAGVTN